MGQLPKVTQEDIDRHFGVLSVFIPIERVVAVPRKKKKKRAKPLPPPIGINLSKIVFTTHALERFVERMLKLDPDFQTFLTPEELARKILADSTEKDAINPAIRVKRCITHGFKEARYFVNSGWRFIVVPPDHDDTRFRVVTIERLRGYDQKPGEIRTMADAMQENEDI